MRIGAMLGDISKSLFKRPVTELYPIERRPAPSRLRGHVQFDPSKCSGCKICIRDCPAEALEMIVVDKATKRFVLRFHVDRCTYCAQCAVSCNFDAITLSHEQWELAALSRTPFARLLGRDEDLRTLAEREAAAATPAAPAAPAASGVTA